VSDWSHLCMNSVLDCTTILCVGFTIYSAYLYWRACVVTVADLLFYFWRSRILRVNISVLMAMIKHKSCNIVVAQATLWTYCYISTALDLYSCGTRFEFRAGCRLLVLRSWSLSAVAAFENGSCFVIRWRFETRRLCLTDLT